MKRGEYECRIMEKYVKLRDQKFKTIIYIVLYQNLMLMQRKNIK